MGAAATTVIATVMTQHSAALHSRAQRLATQRNVRHLHLHSMAFSRAYRTFSLGMLGNLLAQLWVIAAAAAVARGDLEVCSEVTLVQLSRTEATGVVFLMRTLVQQAITTRTL